MRNVASSQARACPAWSAGGHGKPCPAKPGHGRTQAAPPLTPLRPSNHSMPLDRRAPLHPTLASRSLLMVMPAVASVHVPARGRARGAGAAAARVGPCLPATSAPLPARHAAASVQHPAQAALQLPLQRPPPLQGPTLWPIASCGPWPAQPACTPCQCPIPWGPPLSCHKSAIISPKSMQ